MKAIYKALNEVQQKVAFVVKDATVGYGNNAYKAVSHDAVLESARQHLIDAGILMNVEQIEKGVSIPGKTQKGSDKIRFEAMYKVSFIAMEDGSDLSVVCEAHAEDSGDKAANKAITYATKNAMLKVLMLKTGIGETGEELQNTIDTKQAGMLAQLISDTNTDIEKWREHYKIEKVSDLPRPVFAQALATLQAKKKKMKKES